MATWKETAVQALRKLGREATTAEILREIRSLTSRQDLGDSHLLGLAGLMRKHAGPRSGLEVLFYATETRWGLVEWLHKETPPESKDKSPNLPRKRKKRSPLASAALQEWEAQLAPQVRTVELLGEIPITADECAQLGQAIGRYVKRWGHAKALRALQRDYPCAFAVYLVAQGVHGYKGGDYWTEVIEVTGFSPQFTWQVGRAFEQVLEDLHLPLFYDMRAERAHRYISLILAHGGVPNYCLPDLFENVLQPSLRGEYADMSAAEYIDEWQWHARAQHFTDKPVLRFLTYGDRVAEDFFQRCREMAREYLDAGEVPNADQVGLPARVARAYGKWIAEQGADQVHRESGDRWRLRKPEIVVDPWGEGVLLDLPPQQVPATVIHAQFAWEVEADESLPPIPVRVRRSGFDWHTTPESAVLRHPQPEYTVSFLVDGARKRTWHYPGMTGQCPLLVFDADRGTLLAWRHSLPARCLGLVYPAGTELRVEGESRLVEELPRMPWGWANYQGQQWDLAQASCLTLVKDGDEILTVPLRLDEAMQRPHLVGGEPLMAGRSELQAPVYVGSPPSVRIPLTGRGTPEQEFSRWRLTLYNKWTAEPSVRVSQTLADLQSQVQLGDGYVDLALRSPGLLGPSPIGNYTVRLRGPLGRGAEFTLRIVSHLVLCGHEPLYLPDPRSGQQPVTLLVETTSGETIECLGQDASGGELVTCRVQPEPRDGRNTRQHEVEVGPDIVGVEMTVVRDLPSGDAIRVPVHVPIRRLRWAWVEENAASAHRAWTGRVLLQPIEALLQARSPALLIALPIDETDAVRMVVRLLDMDGTVLMEDDLRQPPRGHRLWRADLRGFPDTVRASHSPILHLELVARGLPVGKGPHHWPMLSMTQSLVVENVRVESQVQVDRLALTVRWEEPVSLRHRHLRLWPLWRPWHPFHEQMIPDDAEGELAIELPLDSFPLSKYRLEFVVVDPWSTEQAPQRPAMGTTGTADIALIEPEERQEWLTEQIKRFGRVFEFFLERAIVYRNLGDAVKSREDRLRCREWIDTGTIPQILALHDLMAEIGEQNQLQTLKVMMFSPSRTERLLREHKESKVSTLHYRAYLDRLPRFQLLPEETCTLLLSIEDERARLSAAQQLIRRAKPQGPEAVLRWVQDAQMSDADAVALFKLKGRFSADQIEQHTENPIALRLLEALARELGDRTPIVRPATWTHTSAGWGRINRIEDLEGNQIEQFLRSQDGYRLFVTLRPGYDAETVVVDLAAKRITFPEADRIYTCTKCYCFSSRDHSLVTNPYNGHDGVAHGGEGAGYRPEKTTTRYLDKIEYSARKPKNELE